ncbi:MAG: hypothetical protein AAF226_13025 [Verrucomicrobiota bacterium]
MLKNSLIALGIIAAMVVSVILFAPKPAKTPLTEELVTKVKTMDGFELRVFRVEETNSITMKGSRVLRKFLISRSGSRSISAGPLLLRTKTRNDSLEQASVTADYPALMINATLYSPAGDPIHSDQAYAHYLKTSSEIEYSSEGILRGTRHHSASKSDPAFALQIEDGSGGWINLHGPFCFDKVTGQTVLVSQIYPRTLEKLKLQLIRPDKDPTVFSIDNPSANAGIAATLKPDLKPWQKDLTEATVRVDQIRHSNRKQNSLPTLELAVIPHDSRLDRPNKAPFQTTIQSLEDPWGNRSSRSSFFCLPGVEILTFHGEISRDDRDYLWPRAETTIIAESNYTADETKMEFELTGDGEELGIQNIKTSKTNDMLTLAISGKTKGKPRVNEVADLVVFIEDAERSEQFVGGGSGGWSSSGGKTEFAFNFRDWKPTAEMEGKRIYIGLLDPGATDPEPFSFTLPLTTGE